MAEYSVDETIPRCELCGENSFEFLAFDHIKGGGTHARLIGDEECGHHLARKLKFGSISLRSKYRVLCHNCNFLAIARRKSVSPSPDALAMRELRKKWKAKVFRHYGSRCSCCGEDDERLLSIDHKMGQGKTKYLGADCCRDIIRKGFPKCIRLLCLNCNYADGSFGYCPHKRDSCFKSRLDSEIRRVLRKKPSTMVHSGESNGSAKLTNHKVRKIRLLYKTGNHTQTSLGKEFGVSQVSIGRIVNNISFKEI